MNPHEYVGHMRYEIVGAYKGHPVYVKDGVYGYTFHHKQFKDGYASYALALAALTAEVDNYYAVNFS